MKFDKEEIIKKYASEMEIIKLRIRQIKEVDLKISFLEPIVEFKALQIRKIIEQIMLSSLITNAEEYKKYYNKLENDWNARCIARDLQRINPDFFPKQAINDYEKHIINDAPDSMTCKEIIGIYKKLGKYLHSSNPFSSPIDYKEADVYLGKCTEQLVKLLNNHTIKMYGGNEFLFVVMNSLKDNGNVSINWFEKVIF